MRAFNREVLAFEQEVLYKSEGQRASFPLFCPKQAATACLGDQLAKFAKMDGGSLAYRGEA